jgi:hypothetical protein
MIEVVTGISGAGIVANPLPIVVNVWSLRVPGCVRIMMLLRSGSGMSFTR